MRRFVTKAAVAATTGILALSGAALAGPVGAAGAESDSARAAATQYVALGDSAAAGPEITPQQTRQPRGCLRSQRGLAQAVGAGLGTDATRDMTCTRAKLRNLYAHQGGNRAQLSALSARTTHVSLGPIGAEDAGVLSAVLDCLQPACKERQGRTVHRKIQALRPDVRRAVAAVEDRAPRARVVVVGYGRYFPRGGCPRVQPLTPSNATYAQGLFDHLNRILKSEAKRAGVRFADLRLTPGARQHSACAPVGERWIEGVLPESGDGARGFHPTALGMEAFGAQVVRTLRAPLPR